MNSESLDGFQNVLSQAREMQVRRIQEVFARGFILPEEICRKYAQRYASRLPLLPDQDP